MSTTDLVNMDAFKNRAPASVFKDLNPQSESLADGIGQSYGVIGYKGKNWTLRLRGETYDFKRPDDGTPAPFLDVIILRQLPNKSKSYYPANSYAEGSSARPICGSLDGVTPDAEFNPPQHNACATCPRNVFKVAPDGRKTRECSDYKRLAVLILPKLTAPFFNGKALMEPVFLRVPPASLNDLAMLGDTMAAQGYHFSTFITRIGFKPDKPHPQMMFKAMLPLTEQQAPMVMQLREDMTAKRITGEDVVGKPRQPALAAPAAAPVQQPTNVTPIRQAPKEQPVDDGGFGDVAVTAPVTAAAPAEDDSWGASPAAAPASTASTAAPSDTMTEDADDDLDARVMNLLQR